jgi:hypothetical protein
MSSPHALVLDDERALSAYTAALELGLLRMGDVLDASVRRADEVHAAAEASHE